MQGEKKQTMSGWMKALARALEERLGSNVKTLMKHKELPELLSDDALTNPIATKLDTMANVLKLMPVFSKSGKLKSKLATISQHEIAAVHIICPASMECEDINCKPFALAQDTHSWDIPKVTLIRYYNIQEGSCSIRKMQSL